MNDLTDYTYDGHDRLVRTDFPSATQGAGTPNIRITVTVYLTPEFSAAIPAGRRTLLGNAPRRGE